MVSGCGSGCCCAACFADVPMYRVLALSVNMVAVIKINIARAASYHHYSVRLASISAALRPCGQYSA